MIFEYFSPRVALYVRLNHESSMVHEYEKNVQIKHTKYFYCLIDNFFHIFKSSNFRGCNVHNIATRDKNHSKITTSNPCGFETHLRDIFHVFAC